ncbi:hypothetical protein B0H17DRAFT_1132905 [Mycena rosella]|uniref:Uncharacterized protein n=1 Tax=Mycena rosella TaxID=1033263 RepID=A0AAD7DKG1_MYCRO|nr:hypothetical protein B0H17DRAFT_1132905 [Mycena rosella]
MALGGLALLIFWTLILQIAHAFKLHNPAGPTLDPKVANAIFALLGILFHQLHSGIDGCKFPELAATSISGASMCKPNMPVQPQCKGWEPTSATLMWWGSKRWRGDANEGSFGGERPVGAWCWERCLGDGQEVGVHVAKKGRGPIQVCGLSAKGEDLQGKTESKPKSKTKNDRPRQTKAST